MRRIYVAGAAAEVQRAEAAIAAVRAIGFDIALDWTVGIREANLAGRIDADLSDTEQQRFALADLRAVETADLLWLLAPSDRRGRGSFVELGYALGKGVPCIVSGPDSRHCIFAALCSHEFGTDAEALFWLGSRIERKAAE